MQTGGQGRLQVKRHGTVLWTKDASLSFMTKIETFVNNSSVFIKTCWTLPINYIWAYNIIDHNGKIMHDGLSIFFFFQVFLSEIDLKYLPHCFLIPEH